MSYLLEALRKSEQERQQQVPNLSTATTEWEDADAEPERSPWLILIVAMLAIICLLLVFLVWKASTQNRPNVVEDRPLVNANASETNSNETTKSPNSSSKGNASGVNASSSVSKPIIEVREKPTLTVRTGNAAQIEVKIPTSRSTPSHALAASPQRGAEIISPTRAAVPREQIKKAYDLDDAIRSQLPPMNMNCGTPRMTARHGRS